MARLNIDRQKDLEPKRMEYARSQIMALGYEINEENATSVLIVFQYPARLVWFSRYANRNTGTK